MFRTYTQRLVFRILILFSVLYVYLFQPDFINYFMEFQYGHFTAVHILWIILMTGMILQMIPEDKFVRITMGSRKQFARTYIPPDEGFDKTALYEYILRSNVKSWIVLLTWMSINGVFALLYAFDLIGPEVLVLLSMFFYAADLFCVVIWCPFQSFIMKNRCCVNCRIFNWGDFMTYMPLLFIKSFFTWSLFFTSIIVLIRWEITYACHPYRFWEGSNTALRCENCKDKMCRIKKPLNKIK